MAEPSEQAREAWDTSATSQDVINFGLSRTAFYFAKFGVACTMRDLSAMAQAIKGIRNIATRMEQFRRIKARHWTPAAPAHSKTETKTK
jgi:hypothetical protein